MTDISGFSLDEQMLHLGAAFGRIASLWWARPVAALLRKLEADLYSWAYETTEREKAFTELLTEERKLRRALDEITDDAREQERIALKAALMGVKNDIDAACLRVSAELDRIVATHAEWRG